MSYTKISDKIERVDARTKARGEAMYVCDMVLPGMLYAYMIRSTCPRGKILSIDVPNLPKGYKFITADDIPEKGKNELWMISKDWRAFAKDYVLYVGETIGLLVGPDRTVLKYLKDKIHIEYEAEEPAVTIDDGISSKGGPMSLRRAITSSVPFTVKREGQWKKYLPRQTKSSRKPWRQVTRSMCTLKPMAP